MKRIALALVLFVSLLVIAPPNSRVYLRPMFVADFDKFLPRGIRRKIPVDGRLTLAPLHQGKWEIGLVGGAPAKIIDLKRNVETVTLR